MCEEDRENYRHNDREQGECAVLLRVCCNNKAWNVRRTLSHFTTLDRQLHRCIFDRKFSQLPELQTSGLQVKSRQVSVLMSPEVVFIVDDYKITASAVSAKDRFLINFYS